MDDNGSVGSPDLSQYMPTALDWAMDIVLAIEILILGFWITGRVAKLITHTRERYGQLDSTHFTFLGSIARYVGLAFTFIAVLNRFGVETTSIVALVGAAGLVIGLALQGATIDFAAGVMLMIFRPYKLGDFAEVAGIFGLIDGIDPFTTQLKTLDNRHIIVPNGSIWGEKIINCSLRLRMRQGIRNEASRRTGEFLIDGGTPPMFE